MIKRKKTDLSLKWMQTACFSSYYSLRSMHPEDKYNARAKVGLVWHQEHDWTSLINSKFAFQLSGHTLGDRKKISVESYNVMNA